MYLPDHLPLHRLRPYNFPSLQLVRLARHHFSYRNVSCCSNPFLCLVPESADASYPTLGIPRDGVVVLDRHHNLRSRHFLATAVRVLHDRHFQFYPSSESFLL